MKTIKVLVLTIALGLAGYAYAAGSTDSETRDCKMSGATVSCCVADAKCCKSDESCCKSCAEGCKSETGCCGKVSKCCSADGKGCTAEEGCCKADSKTGSGCCGASCGKPKNT